MDQDEHSPSVFYYAKDLETFDSETETGTRVPYNKLLTNLARSGRTGEYWSLVVFVRTERSEVRAVTTSSQYSPSRSVSKRFLFTP